MRKIRTSLTDPLQIAQVSAAEYAGQLGITFCPGKQDPFAFSCSWQRDLDLDLIAIKQWSPKIMITLLEEHELQSLKVPELGQAVQTMGVTWLHLPIADYSIPDQHFEKKWCIEGEKVRAVLRQGQRVLIHCKGGLGRAGMIAARLLVELGMEPKMAISQVRHVRKGAIETPSQLNLVRQTAAIPTQR